jgi:protein-disulfide isomerase
MSNRNSHANKQAARERLRAERERQAKKEKIRRQLVVAGSIVAVLAVATGIGIVVSNMGGSDSAVSNADWKAEARQNSFTKPANTSGDKGTTVVIGEKDAKNTLQIFEDMRCPVCASFEQSVGETVIKDMEAGTYKLQFTMATFLDEAPQISGSGSHNALSALGAALNVSPDAFLDYKAALYAKANHPQETDDAFADDEKLIKIAQSVQGLKGNTAFEKDVKDGTYDKWAIEMSDAFNAVKDVTGTPTLKLNGTKLTAEGSENAPMLPEQFIAARDKLLNEKG